MSPIAPRSSIRFAARLRSQIGALLAAVCCATFPLPASAYGPAGHQTVGAVADRLIVGTPAGARVQAILGGETLEAAAGSIREGSAERYHYTAVPLQEPGYRDGLKGVRSDDVVRMVRRCITVLQGGSDSQLGSREALRLLAHLVGDLHQPLNIGSAFLDPSGQLVRVRAGSQGESTDRGRAIRYEGGSLHDFWENKTVEQAMSQAGAGTPRAFAQVLTTTVPAGINTGELLGPASRVWANEMMPVAREAYVRLRFGPRETTGGRPAWEASGRIVNATYDTWATQVTRRNLALGGYRLASVLKRIWPGEVSEARRATKRDPAS